ncbi:hypothetical protein HQQ80_00955 [Microbacteriaceae bacterium VKM Ac-2855]|nr:hypothetical protein [Microbacteriaceae bacterium VKM Ac-2855]
MLAIISGRPVIALSMAVPLYRDLRLGEEGDDVSAFQRALADAGLDVEDTGIVDWQTQQGIRELYDRVDADAPGGDGTSTYVDIQELVFLPSVTASVSEIAEVGTTLGETTMVSGPTSDPSTSSTSAPTAAAAAPVSGSSTGETLATLQIAPNRITAHATVLDADAFPVGQMVTVSAAAGASSRSTVTAVGPFSNGGNDGAGYDLTIDLGDAPAGTLSIGASVQVTTTTDSTEGPAVPLVAIRQSGGKTFVQPSPTAGSTPPPMVEVVILRQADGWAAIEPGDALPVGTSVRVSP